MKKLGILLDSFSGRTKSEIEELGFEYVPQSIIIDGRPFLEGIDIELKTDYEKINNASDIKTSMPSIGSIIEKFEVMSKEYENVIYIPMQKGLSSTYSVAWNAAKEHQNVYLVDSKLIGSGIIDIASRAVTMAEGGMDIVDVIKSIENISKKSVSYIVPKDVSALIRSGRLSGAKKIIMEKAKLIPRLLLTDDGFKVTGISKNFSKTCKGVVDKIIEEIGVKKVKDYNWEIVGTGAERSTVIAEGALKFKGILKISKSLTSVGVAAHSGIGAVGITAWPKK